MVYINYFSSSRKSISEDYLKIGSGYEDTRIYVARFLPDMNGLVAIVLYTLASVVEASTISVDSSLDSDVDYEATTRDVYGSWTLGEPEKSSESEDESVASSTNSLFQKHYWVTHYWRTPEWEPRSGDKSQAARRRVLGRYLYRGKAWRNSTGRTTRRNRTTRIVTGRWPKRKINGSRHSVKPGFGRPRKNSTAHRLITPGLKRRRVPRIHYPYRSRVSPYFHWHTTRNVNSSIPRVKICRGTRLPYGTRKPPRPNRFKWVSQFHRTKMYVGNLTCRLFIMRNRTTVLLISPRRNTTQPTVSVESGEDGYDGSTEPLLTDSTSGTTNVFDAVNTAENDGVSSVLATASDPISHVHESRVSAFDYANGTTLHTLSRQIHSSADVTNSTTEITNLAQTNTSSTRERKFPDISYKLRYSPEPNCGL